MKKILLAASMLAGLALSPAAHADLIFDLTAANSGITSGPGGGVGPYVGVDIHRNSTTSATATFTGLGVYELMDGGSLGLNVNGAFALGAISGVAAAGATQATYSNGGAGNEDGFGSFNLTINSSDGWASRSQSITVTFTDLSAPWLTDASVLTNNASGEIAASHIGFDGGSFTGFASDPDPTPPTPAPEPMSLVVLGSGFVALGVLRRRKNLTV